MRMRGQDRIKEKGGGARRKETKKEVNTNTKIDFVKS